jgi:hypothetical protein
MLWALEVATWSSNLKREWLAATKLATAPGQMIWAQILRPRPTSTVGLLRNGWNTNTDISFTLHLGDAVERHRAVQIRDRKPRSAPVVASGLDWVTIAKPEDRNDPNTRRIIRSKAMKVYHARRKIKAQSTIPLAGATPAAPRLPQQNLSAMVVPKWRWCRYCHANVLVDEPTFTCAQHSSHAQLKPGPIGLLGGGRIDPFASYPRPVSYHEHKFIDYCKHSANATLHVQYESII